MGENGLGGVLVVIDSGLIIITSKAFILFVYSALDFLVSSYAFLFIYVLAWLYDAFYCLWYGGKCIVEEVADRGLGYMTKD